MKPRHQSYFYHSRKERNALIILLSLCFICAALPHLYILMQKDASFSNLVTPEVREWIKLTPEKKYPASHRLGAIPDSSPAGYRTEKFVFDPNTASVADFRRLGLSEKQATVIYNYRQKGGKFRHPADIRKIWGISTGLAQELEPFIQIKETGGQKLEWKEDRKWIPKQVKTVNINTADSLQFLSLPGIGPGFTSRILKFRGRLGGFISVNQLAEVYGLPDSVFQKIKPYLKCEPGQVKRMNINTAPQDELGQHPYIRYHLAKLIIAYRNQHGNFKELEDLKKIMILTDSLYNRINPYLSIN